MRTVPIVCAAAAALAAPASARATAPDAFATGILAAHNAERSAVGLPPLVWDNALAAGAASWAQEMARTGVFDHSDRHARRGIGENIWSGPRGAYNPEQMVALWISDKRSFTPGIFPNTSRTGNWYDASHYTQIIWPNTKRVGCAIASNASTDYFVCRYSPAGNIDGTRVP